MKLFYAIVIALLAATIFMIPADNASTQTWFSYTLWGFGALAIIYLIFKYGDASEDTE